MSEKKMAGTGKSLKLLYTCITLDLTLLFTSFTIGYTKPFKINLEEKVK